MAKHGHIVWNELNTRNIRGAQLFSGKMMGWTFEAMPMPEGTYWVAKMNDDMVGGLFDISNPMFEGVPEHWFTYIEVDNVDRRLEGIVAAGGTIKRPAWDIPGIGRVAIVADPGGAVQGWMTSVQR